MSYSNAGLQVQQIENLPGQEPGMRLPVFDIDVRAQRENAYTKMSQNELALQFWSTGLLNPQNVDQTLIVLDMMDFRGKDDLKRKVQAQGTMQQMLVQVAQIAMALAQQYAPEVAEQLAQIVSSVAESVNAVPSGGGGTQPKQLAGQVPHDTTEKANEANENTYVRKAREQAQQAARPD